MRVVSRISAARKAIEALPRPLVLVPTMGALHAGHAALLRKARSLAGDTGSVAVSIFVNPTQFAPGEDFGKYPRAVREDLTTCRSEGVDLVFTPTEDELYAKDHSTFVVEGLLSSGLCGEFRPGHFRGVCTVVAQLFLILRPDAAIFGSKDYQQLAVIRRMVRDLHFGIRILGHPTVREKDGLAMSSRNRYLSPEERSHAPAIYRALQELRGMVRSGENRISTLERRLRSRLSRIPSGTIDYAKVVDAETLQPVRIMHRPTVALVALRLPSARLIDNLVLRPRTA